MNNNVLVFLPAMDFSEEEFRSVKTEIEKKKFSLFITSDAYGLCIGSYGAKVKADINLFNVNENNFAAFVLIGGKGTRNYWNNTIIHSIVKKFNDKKKIVGAICTAPVILAKAGILNKLTATCNKEDSIELIKFGAEYKDWPVIIRENIITANGPGAGNEFSFEILNRIK